MKNKIFTKIVFKKDYGFNWPFYNDSVTIEREGSFICVFVNGKRYALNGVARTKYNMSDVFDNHVAIRGKSVGPFIKLGLDLGK